MCLCVCCTIEGSVLRGWLLTEQMSQLCPPSSSWRHKPILTQCRQMQADSVTCAHKAALPPDNNRIQNLATNAELCCMWHKTFASDWEEYFKIGCGVVGFLWGWQVKPATLDSEVVHSVITIHTLCLLRASCFSVKRLWWRLAIPVVKIWVQWGNSFWDFYWL